MKSIKFTKQQESYEIKSRKFKDRKEMLHENENTLTDRCFTFDRNIVDILTISKFLLLNRPSKLQKAADSFLNSMRQILKKLLAYLR